MHIALGGLNGPVQYGELVGPGNMGSCFYAIMLLDYTRPCLGQQRCPSYEGTYTEYIVTEIHAKILYLHNYGINR